MRDATLGVGKDPLESISCLKCQSMDFGPFLFPTFDVEKGEVGVDFQCWNCGNKWTIIYDYRKGKIYRVRS